MENKNSLRKKLAGYSVLSTAFLARGAVQAQVNYVDIIPDDTLYSGNPQYSLDLNNDGAFDVYIACGSNVALFSTFIQHSLDVMGSVPSNNYTYVSLLACGDLISPSKSWHTVRYLYDGILLYQYGSGFIGHWQDGIVDGYAGLRLRKIDTTYAWIRMDVAPDASYVILKDYAYSTIPNVGITACDGLPLMVNEPLANHIQLYPNPAENKAVITCPQELIGATLSVYDITGRKFLSMKISIPETQLDVSALPPGIFTISVLNDKAIWNRKLQVVH